MLTTLTKLVKSGLSLTDLDSMLRAKTLVFLGHDRYWKVQPKYNYSYDY